MAETLLFTESSAPIETGTVVHKWWCTSSATQPLKSWRRRENGVSQLSY